VGADDPFARAGDAASEIFGSESESKKNKTPSKPATITATAESPKTPVASVEPVALESPKPVVVAVATPTSKPKR